MKYIVINPGDSVLVALENLKKGETVMDFALSEDIPAGHKASIREIRKGEKVIKYGYPIGSATRDIHKGCLVDHSCLETGLGGMEEYTYTPAPYALSVSALPVERSTFRGFRRRNGSVGVRNQIWIIPTVGCVNGIAQTLSARFREEIRGNMGSVDAVVAFTHNYGCSQLGEDHRNTQKILADLVCHPNAGGVLIVSLGCENNQLSSFLEVVGDVDPARVKTMTVQQVEGDEIEYGLGLLRDICRECSADRREVVPVSELKVGLKCGGSDGLSGITANPLLGVVSDWIAANGGTTVLTEVPEMFGAETLLMNRCRDRAVFEKTVSLINGFKRYYLANGQPVYENPSPGNKAGGISTLEEKSLGCTQKSGSSIVNDVVEYGGRLKEKGLNLLGAPGNDLVASTALAAAGCQMVLFTTGRGTPFGCPVPTVKISTNSPLASRKPSWIDYNAGVIAEGASMDSVAADFVKFILDVAEGRSVNNEVNGWSEIAVFKSGVTL